MQGKEEEDDDELSMATKKEAGTGSQGTRSLEEGLENTQCDRDVTSGRSETACVWKTSVCYG